MMWRPDISFLECGPGDWRFGSHDGHVIGINFKCPCCGASYHLDFEKIEGRGCWTWNGDRAKPTLTPSIWAKKYCGYHGHLTDGIFTQ